MYDQPTEQVRARLAKIDAMRRRGVDPYPVEAYRPTHEISTIVADPSRFEANGEPIRIAGRIASCRSMGQIRFLDLIGGGAQIQAYVERSALPSIVWEVLECLDLGDFLGVSGPLFRTRTNELTIRVEEAIVLGKASHPVPLPKRQRDRSFSAVVDKEVLYRQRHIDLLVTPGSRELFIKRSQIVRGIRSYLDAEGFIEVETPILGTTYGGAAARPFMSHLNARHQDVYLRVSPECALKRLLAGGLERVYEVGKNFRNEGMDSNHNPEFTMVEWYEAWSDYIEQMTRFETLVAVLSDTVNGDTRVMFRGRPIDLAPPWRRMPMLDGLREHAGIDASVMDESDLRAAFHSHHPRGLEAVPEPFTWGAAVVELFDELVVPLLWDPVFVMDHPLEVSPLTKVHRRDKRLVERFEPMIAGIEVGNSYSELNDPVEQYQRLAQQQVSRAQTYDMDYDFLAAVAHGMPQAGGTGMGVDRIVMILTGAQSIRDVILFPFCSARREDSTR
jgi:lysyl-tRNA synthetase class 2